MNAVKSDNYIIHLQFNTRNSSPQNQKICTTHQEQKAEEQLIIVVYTPLQSNSINLQDHFISFILHFSHSYPSERKKHHHIYCFFLSDLLCLRSSRSESNASTTITGFYFSTLQPKTITTNKEATSD